MSQQVKTLPHNLSRCPDCRKAVSNEARRCPHCGKPMNSLDWVPFLKIVGYPVFVLSTILICILLAIKIFDVLVVFFDGLK